ncbi:MAG TPA: 23S rRNA (guanosine(2251)-2'-O)-methyltransferase RlmB [Luteibaculaceae bacterium]|nr:23S rRNA (guanosine(2251)-2'-O)-methyltransferase RlmB [Luteibaculaceae bacterium]
MNSPKSSQDSIIFGTRPIIEALKLGKEIDKILIQQGLLGEQVQEIKMLLKDSGTAIQYVPGQKLDSITRKNHQGVIAYIAPITYSRIENLLPELFERGVEPMVLVLDRVTDVRNFGAIVRTAECAGVHAIVIPQAGAARINEDAVKTSAGALFNIPICKEANLKYTIAFLQASGLQVVACTEKTKTEIYDIDLNRPTAILMGSEEDGISPALLKVADSLAAIPLAGKTGSLNVSVAAGVILYEALRQRKSA